MKYVNYLILLLFFQNAVAIEYHNGGGATYTIQERNALEEIKERAKGFDVKSFIEEYPREGWSLWKGYPLPRALKNRVRFHIPFYSLEYDITDKNGAVIYPKGFTFNPLQYINYPTRIVVFKLDQYNAVKPHLKLSDMLVADTGDVVKAGSENNNHFFILDKKMVERLGIEKVPSIIEQDGQRFKITELKIYES